MKIKELYNENIFVHTDELLSRIVTISESGIWHVLQKTQKGPYLIMSAWRAIYPRQKNRLRNADLRHRLFTNYGLASIKQQGYWPAEYDEHGNVTVAGKEDSIFVPMYQPTSRIKNINEFISLAKEMMNLYNQDAVIVNDGKSTYLLSKQPSTEEIIGNKINVFGKNKDIGNAPAWSSKGNYRYTITDEKVR
jgi:hypothetical protein